GSHTQQTASVMTLFEKVLEDEQPQVVLVVGDVNSTVACSLVTSKFRPKRSLHLLPRHSRSPHHDSRRGRTSQLR
ncbi:MAG: UDP-N-acetyl glucosamine 2-epimerase, partial [Myxococcales bacterium]|nr:UDP-N-acetyl glucosamine 2-epimerase [Myxococcales bacterium]